MVSGIRNIPLLVILAYSWKLGQKFGLDLVPVLLCLEKGDRAWGDTWLGCLWGWNCACNGLIFKVDFRFEGGSLSSGEWLSPTYKQPPPSPEGRELCFVFFPYTKQDNNEEEKGDEKTIISFLHLPRTSDRAAVKLDPSTTATAPLSSYLPVRSLWPPTTLRLVFWQGDRYLFYLLSPPSSAAKSFADAGSALPPGSLLICWSCCYLTWDARQQIYSHCLR